MMRLIFRHKYIWLLLLICGMLAVPAAVSPWDAWRLGYTNFEQGEEFRDRGEYARARESFIKAKEHYLVVQRSRPDWNQRIIKARLKDCDKAITDLNRLLGNGAVETAAAVPGNSSVPGGNAGAAAPASSGEVKVLQERLNQNTGELTKLKKELESKKDMEKEVAALLREQRAGADKYALLEQRYKQLQSSQGSDSRQMAELKRQLVEERLRRDKVSGEYEELKRQYTKNSNELDFSRRAAKVRDAERKTLQETVDKLRGELTSARNFLTKEQESARKNADAALQKLQASEERNGELLAQLAAMKSLIAELEASGRTRGTGGTKVEDAKAEAVRARYQQQIDQLSRTQQAAERRAADFQREQGRLRQNSQAELKRFQQNESELKSLRIENEKINELLKTRTGELALASGELKRQKELYGTLERDFKSVNEERNALSSRLKNRDKEDFRKITEVDEVRRKMEKELTEVRLQLAEFRNLSTNLAISNKEKTKEVEDLRRVRDSLDQRVAQIPVKEGEIARLKAAVQEAGNQYNKLNRDFQALVKENRENKVRAEAAKPREAELARIKLRLAELEELKGRLAAAERLNGELTASRKRLVAEVEKGRAASGELDKAKRQLARVPALENELKTIKDYNRKLGDAKTAKRDLIDSKRRMVDAEAAQLELFELKKVLLKLEEANTSERNKVLALESEKNRLEGRMMELLHSSIQGSSDSNAASKTHVKEIQQLQARQNLELQQQRELIAGQQAQLSRQQRQLAELNALRSNNAELRKFNSELLYAKNFESELHQAKLSLADMERLKAELDRVDRLNQSLEKEKTSLEKELSRRELGSDAKEVSVVTRNKEKPEDYLAAGRFAAADGDMELALWNFNRALVLNEDDSDALVESGRILLSRENYAEAYRRLSRGRLRTPENLELIILTARAAIGAKKYGNAEAVLAPQLEKHGKNSAILTLYAMTMDGIGRSGAAEKYFRLAIRFADAKDYMPSLEFARHLVHSDGGRIEDAASFYDDARRRGARPDLELEPVLGPKLDKERELENFLLLASREAAQKGDYNAVIWYSRRLIELERHPERFIPHLAFAQYKTNRLAAARETLTFRQETGLSNLVKACLEIKDGDKQAAEFAVKRAKQLSGGAVVVIPADFAELAVELTSLSSLPAGSSLQGAFVVGRPE